MIDIEELRRLTQEASAAPDGLSAEWMDRLGQFQEAADASVVSELLDRLEAAEKDIALKERVIDSLGSALNAAAHERDNLRAKIAEMEKQEPVAEIGQQYTLLFAGSDSITRVVKRHGLKIGDKLYALPGAKGEEK